MRTLARSRRTTISRRSGSGGAWVVIGSASPGRTRTALIAGARLLMNVRHEPPRDALHVFPVDRIAGQEPPLHVGPDVEGGGRQRDQDEIPRARERDGVAEVAEDIADVDRGTD